MANLILTICSNQKKSGGHSIRSAVGENNNAQAITTLLPSAIAKEIFTTRKKAFRHITKSGAQRDGGPLSKMPYNKELKRGADITGNHSEGVEGFYMPAQQRYDGRFYKAFRDAAEHKLRLGEKFGNYMLIISGLYGVLTLDEPIQRYSCNVQDDMVIRQRWKKGREEEGGLLTRILLAFIEKFKVRRVFDLMADDSYRHLVEWELIERRCDDVFYSHSDQQRGADMLPELGRVAGRMLSGQEERSFSDINSNNTDSENTVGEVRFSTTPPVWIPSGAVSKKWTSFAAWVVSMEANIHCFLNKAGVSTRRNIGFYERSGWLKQTKYNNSVVRAAMRTIAEFRNKVVHKNYVPDEDEVLNIREQYKKIVRWADGIPDQQRAGCTYDKKNLKDVDY